MSPSRREFLVAGANGIGLLIAVGQLGCRPRPVSDAATGIQPSQWLRIDPSGQVTVINDKSEMGQGAGTAIPLLVAEELGVGLETVRVEHAKPGPAFDSMGTSGSDSVSDRWIPLRTAAAAAREMLIAAAAGSWKVAPGDCAIEGGRIKHRSSGRVAALGCFVAAAARLEVPSAPPLKPASGYTLVGTRVPRLDLAATVRGAKQYAGDLRLPGMLRATVARSPAPGGRPVRWSAEQAKQIAGVRDAFEVPAGIAVVADSTWAALEGRRAWEVEWDQSVGAGIDSPALWTRLEAAFDTASIVARKEGEVAPALAAATKRLSAEYRYPFQAHGAVEPLNAIAQVGSSRCEIWVGTQNANRIQSEISELLGLKPEQIVVNVLPLGGGFGRRIAADFVQEAVTIARHASIGGQPVQLIWTREDDFGYDMYQSAAIVRMAAGLDGSGRVAGWSHRVADFHLSMFGDFDPKSFKPAEDLEPWGGIDTPYDFPALEVAIARLPSPVRTGAWRSVFYPSSVMARECFLDEVAQASGKDPIALRLELLAKPNVITRGSSSRDNRARLRAVVSLAAERGGWGTALPDRGPGRRVGRGFACNEYHGATVIANVAEVSVGARGDVVVHRIVVAMECGRPVNLDGIEAQIEGGVTWALSTLFGKEITFAGGRTEQHDYQGFPVLRIDQVPRIEAHVVPSSLNPFGVGEQPVPAVIPAVLNAIFAATGRRIRQIPLNG
jgi:isoquinoline 1-oxidoreductase beta subunit